ncbi:MAG: LamG-like jellyroll fold domain-containing protein, partial [Flavipsychrobacter sp.]
VENHHVFSKNYPYGYGAPSADDLFIGCSDNPLGPNIYNFFGRIDDIKLYDGAMYCPPALVELCAQCNSQMPAPTPVAHWGFDGNNGNNPYIDDINGLVGVPTGTPVSAPGQNGLVNTALHFNGIGDYIQVASSPILDLQSWTIRAVFKPDGFYAGSCQGNIIVKRGAQFGPNHYSLLFTDNIYDNNNCTATVDPNHENITAGAAGVDPMPTSAWLNGPATSPTNQYIAAGQWYCVTASYDGVAGRMRLFVDGMLVYDNPWNNQYGPPAIEDLFIGGDNTINPYYFNGTIDDIAIYDGATDCAMSCRNAFNGQPKIANGVNKVNGRSSLAITPNPATNEVKITIPTSWGKTTWTLTNSAGQVLQTGEIKANTTQAVINVSNLPVGMYILKAEHGTSSEYQKLIKN